MSDPRATAADPGVAKGPGRRPKSRFGADVLKLVSGASLAQLTSIAVAPIVARMYGPEDFGVAALFTSITGIITVVACLRYELSIVLPEHDDEAANLLGASLLIATTVAVATVPIVVFGRRLLLGLLKAPELGPVLWLIPPMIFLSGISLAFSYWNSRARRFGRLSVARVSSSATTSVVQVGAGLAGRASGPTLVSATVLGTAVSTVVLGGQILREDGLRVKEHIGWKPMWEGLRRHRKFPVYGAGAAVLNATSWQLPALLLQSYFSATTVGFYALGNRILRLPMSLIGIAIGQVFFQHAAEAHREGRLAATVESAFRRLVTLGLVPSVASVLVGREAFALVFGARWAEAGFYAQILAPWTFVWFLSSPLSQLFSILERQEFGLKLDVAIFVSRFGSLAAGGILKNARLAIFLFSATGVIVYGYYTFAILKASGVDVAKMARFLLGRVLGYLPAVAILTGMKLVGLDPRIVVGVTILIMGAYSIWTIRSDDTIRTFMMSYLSRGPIEEARIRHAVEGTGPE